ncbi:hypothetical protein [Sulfurimonas sp.]
MKNVIILSLGVLLITLTACTQSNTPRPDSQKKLQKSAQQMSKKKKPVITKEEKVVNDYKKVVQKNIQKNKKINLARKKFEQQKQKLLEEMQLARKDFAKTDDREAYLQRQKTITKKINKLQEELDATLKKNEIINYTNENR